MYKLMLDPITGENGCIVRLSDKSCIPFDPANTDYQQYLAWVAAGNQPLPADAPVQNP